MNERNCERRAGEISKAKQKMFFETVLVTQIHNYTSITVHLQESLCERCVTYRSPESQN